MTEQNEKSKLCFCPNCQEPAKKIGSEIICEKCDARYEIKKTGAAKVKATGEIEELRGRVDALEAAILPDEDEPAAEPEPDEDQPEPDEDEGILPG